MRHSRKFIGAGLALLLAAGLVFAAVGLSRTTVSEVSAREMTRDQAPAVAVQAASVRLGPVQSAVAYSGNIKVQDEVQVLPKVSGRLLELKVDIGDPVKKGDVIARVDTDTATAQLLLAQAGLYMAQAKLSQMDEGPRSEQVAQAAAAVKNAQAKLDRTKAPLNQNEIDMAKAGEVAARATLQQAQSAYDKIAWFDGKGALPQSLALQQATTAYEAAKAAYQEKLAGAKPEDIRAQEATVEQMKAGLALAKAPFRSSDYQLARAGVLQAQAVVYAANLQLNECTLKAPMDGVVSAAPLAVGAIAGLATPVVTLVTSKVEINVKVEESRIAEIKKGQPATIQLAAYPDQKFSGKVTRISPTADPADRTFQVRIEPDGQNEALRGGMFAEVSLIAEQHADALLVPRASVVADGGRSFVFAVVGDRVERREVTLGLSQGNEVQVVSGLMSGDRVVTVGQAGLKDNDEITVTAIS